jgi:hypothetical protein
MSKVLTKLAFLLAITATTLTACKKDDTSAPPPPPPTGEYAVKVRASITIGEVVYDSIPASVTITSWDQSGVAHQREAQLAAGTNTVQLPKAHTRYSLKLAKWGVTDERVLVNSEVNESTTYTLGGSKAAKKLAEEVGYQFKDGSYQLYNKVTYTYDNEGRLKEIGNYFIDTEHPTPHLVLSRVDRFVYNGGRVEKIESIDKHTPGDPVVEYSAFTWNGEGKIAGIHYGEVGATASCRMEYATQGSQEVVRVSFLEDNTDNGSRAELTFAGGNRVEEKTFIPNYLTATRTFTYDDHINPYVHMKWPQINLVHQSKNNVLEERPDFAAVVLKCDYTYDADGYVAEVRKSEVKANGTTPVLKKVYTY